MRYRVPGHKPEERDLYELFTADSDEAAVKMGMEKFLEKAKCAFIPAGSILMEIFRTPTNLLGKRYRVEEQRGQSGFSLVA